MVVPVERTACGYRLTKHALVARAVLVGALAGGGPVGGMCIALSMDAGVGRGPGRRGWPDARPAVADDGFTLGAHRSRTANSNGRKGA